MPLHNPANLRNFNRRGHFLVKRIKLLVLTQHFIKLYRDS
jgi:hypothetical protein